MKSIIAEKLIERIARLTAYDINLIDDDAVILASTDHSRIGTFSETADRLLRSGAELFEDREGEGGAPSIFVVVAFADVMRGVVQIMGDPDENREAALLLKTTVETMYGYEKQKEEDWMADRYRDSFFSLLTQPEECDPEELGEVAQILEYDESVVRSPILCRIRGKAAEREKADAELVLACLRRSAGCATQDISSILDVSHIMVFKSIRAMDSEPLDEYRKQLMEYILPVRSELEQKGISCTFYIGTMQKEFSRYYYAYRHCKWMEANIENPSGVEFFSKHAIDYFRKLWPKDELDKVFRIFEPDLTKRFKRQYLEVVKALMSTNYNIAEASRMLGLHRNTLVYRYNKVKEMLSIDPMSNAADRGLLELLYYYLT